MSQANITRGDFVQKTAMATIGAVGFTGEVLGNDRAIASHSGENHKLSEKKSDLSQEDSSIMLPVIPLRIQGVPPKMIASLNAVRKLSARAVKHALETDSMVFLLEQQDKGKETPTPGDLHRVGTVARIIDTYDPHDGTIRITVQGEDRASVLRCFESDGWLQAEVQILFAESNPVV